MKNNILGSARGQIVPVALMLVLGAGLGTASMEISKRAGWGPFHVSKAVAEVAKPTALTQVAFVDVFKLQGDHALACSCGATKSQQSHPLYPSRASAGLTPAHARRKSAGDCLQANVADPSQATDDLTTVAVYREALKGPGLAPLDAASVEPAVLVVGNAAAPAGTMVAAVPADFDSGLFVDPMVSSTFAGGSHFVGGEGLLASMAASESFGDPIVFAATSNPDTGSSTGTSTAGGSATAAAGDTPVTVPAPSPLALFALGMLCLAASRGRSLLRLKA